MTALKHENHDITVISINAATIPYTIDSSVRGLPLLRYVNIVAPSWLNAGFMRAVTISMGSRNKALNFNAFLPLIYTEYAKAQTSDRPRHMGCVRNMANVITAVKKSMFTAGW
jgi:hypothetical protein